MTTLGPPPYNGPPFDATLDPGAPLLLTHGVFMFLAFGICIPLAAFFAHYHRNSELFQAHYWINTFGTLGLSLVAFALAAVYHTSSQTPHFASAHSIFGIVILFWLCLQQVGGCVLHYFYDERIKAHRDGRGVGPWVHIASGSLCLLGGIASCGLGIWRYQEWYQGDPQLSWILIGSLVAWLLLFSGLLAVIGEYCVPPPPPVFAGLSEAEANFIPPTAVQASRGVTPAAAIPRGGYYEDLDAQIERDRRAQMEMMERRY